MRYRLALAAVGSFMAAILPVASSANDLTLQAEVDADRIGIGERLQLSIVAQGRGADRVGTPSAPPLRNLRVVGGPFLSTQISIANGAMSQTKTFTYVLQPIALGQAEIGAARIRLEDGTEKATSPIKIEVVAGATRTPEPRRTDPFGFDEDPFERFFGRRRERQPIAQPKILVRAVASRNRVYVGEPLLLAYFIYTQAQISDFGFAESPKYPGFWSEDPTATEERIRGERATLDGESYIRYPIRRKLLFPTRAGQLDIPSATVRVSIPGFGFFDPGPTVIERTANALSITAEAIPTTPGFSGAVGRYSVSSALDRSNVPLGEAVTLRFRVEGSGNLKWIEEGPTVNVDGAKVYPPQVKNQLRTTPSGISGSKTWEYIVVPETSGRIEFPALAFSYFDPKSKRVVRLETAPLALDVSAGQGAAPVALPRAMQAPSVSSRGLTLRADLDAPPRWMPRPRPATLAIVLLSALMAHLVLWGGARVHLPRLGGGKHGAPRMTVRKALDEIRRVHKKPMSKEAAAALVEKAILDVFGDLDDSSNASERERAARAVLDDVRFLRYAPQLGDYTQKIRDVAARAMSVIRRWA